MVKQFTLGKKERLKSKKLIERLFSEGKSFYVQPYKVHYLIIDKMFSKGVLSDNAEYLTGNIQFGISVPAKNFKKAVDRNKIKRLTREAYRLQKKELQEKIKQKKTWLIIFFIYIDRELPDFNAIKIKVNVALKKILQLTGE